MSKQQRDAIDAALRAEPFGLNQSTDGHEVLLDDAVRLAANAGRDDVDVTLQIAPEGTHVFQLHFGVLDEADEAIDEVARFFTRHAGWAGR
jgi:acetyl esterase/lipase